MIANKIKYLRKKVYGLTQQQLADKISVSRSTVNNWEAGIASPSLQHIILISVIFKVSAHYLIFASDIADEILLDSLNSKQKKAIMYLYDCFLDELH